MPEDSVLAGMVRILTRYGCEVIKTHGSGLRSGEPDLIGVIAPWGFHICVEVKRPGERPSTQQRLRLLAYARRGSIAIAADNPEVALSVILHAAYAKEAAIKGNISHNDVEYTLANLLS